MKKIVDFFKQLFNFGEERFTEVEEQYLIKNIIRKIKESDELFL